MESLWIQVALGALKSFSFVYDVITFPIYLLLQRPWKRRVMSRRIKVSNQRRPAQRQPAFLQQLRQGLGVTRRISHNFVALSLSR